MKILLAIDPSGASDLAVKEVAKRPWPSQTKVEALSVVEPHQVFDVPSLIEGLEAAAKDAAESAIRDLRSAGIDAVPCVRRGHAKDVIVERARETGADLVNVGSRSLHGIEHFLLGSVAATVARFAPCSVEIVREKSRGKLPESAMKILLATDGSEFSQLAARSVADRPRPSGPSACILSVAELSVPLQKLPDFSASAMENSSVRRQCKEPKRQKWPPRRY